MDTHHRRHLLLFRPPKPMPCAASCPPDGDLLELDVLWAAGSDAPRRTGGGGLGLGILAALPEDEKKKKRMMLRSAARPIPEASPAPAPAAGSAYGRSAPVRIPSAARRRWGAPGGGPGDHVLAGSEMEEGEMVPPHEIVARRCAAHSSMLEGAGRTLKGRDLRRVRNAVWHRTGFLN